MKQAFQDLSSHVVRVEEVPPPRCLPGGILVKTAASLISCGTERAMVALGAKTLFGKALERPDLVARVHRHFRTAGLRDTVATVRARLQTAVALGYSAAGVVLEVGAEAGEFAIGDRVACAGAGYASHAEINWVPKNLCTKVPPGVDFDEASAAAVGSIALQAVRVAEVKLGERVAVIGLGLVGQFVSQILQAAGCVVWGLDPDHDRAALAIKLGANFVCENSRWQENPWAESVNRGQGMDAVIITASTRSSEPVETAGRLARDRGVVVIVGDVRADIPRETYYGKELRVRYSRSYGPGRYDPVYEQRGVDYPYGFVRWTEKRNLQAFLELLAGQKVRVRPLITHRFAIHEAREAYDLLTGKKEDKHLGILLTHCGVDSEPGRVLLPGNKLHRQPNKARPGAIHIGWIGAGSFSRSKLLPALRKIEGAKPVGLANATGISARKAALDFGFRYCTTDASEILNDPDIDAVFIATRHDLHAPLVQSALELGKHVFVEKPMCVNENELNRLAETYAKSQAVLSVGFNRRFSPFARDCKRFFEGRSEPLTILYRINAGVLDHNHWISDPGQGHGRVIGEICHFVDFVIFLASSLPKSVHASPLPGNGSDGESNLHVQIRLEDGSSGEIFYLSSGDVSVPKERIEVFAEGRTATSDDFARSAFYSRGRCKTTRFFHQDKGHRDELRAFIQSIAKGERAPIPFEELYATTLATFRIRESLSCGTPLPLLNA